jgi:hypothetical protein
MSANDYELIETFQPMSRDVIPKSERSFPLVLASGLRYTPVLTIELYVKWYTLYLVDRMKSGTVQIYKIHYGHLEDFRPEDQSAYVDHVPNPLAVRNFADSKSYYLDELADDLLMGRWQNEVVDQDVYCPHCGGIGMRFATEFQDPTRPFRRCPRCKGKRTVKHGA